MTERDTAEYLEELAQTLASHGSNLAALRMAELEQKVSPYLAAPGVPTRRVGSDRAADTLGNVRVLYGQRNLLLDPTFENFVGGTITAVDTSRSALWGTDAWYTLLVSGCGPSPYLTIHGYRPTAGANPLISNVLYAITDVVTGAGTHELRLRSRDYSPVSPRLPYLVAAVQLPFVGSGADTNVTSKTVTLEIYDSTSGVVRATASADKDFIGQLFCATLFAEESWAGHAFQLRLRFTMVTTGASGAFTKDFGEPQLCQSYSADPPAYQPILGGWFPSRVWSSATDDIINARQVGYSYDRYRVDNEGGQHYGVGSSAADLRLYRTATKTLTVDDDAGGAATFKVVGVRQALPSSSQTLLAATALLANAEIVMFTCTGAVTTTAAPTIADGLDGQVLVVLNVGSGTWTIKDQGTLAGSNLRLAAATVAIAPRNSVKFVYSATVGDWVQVGPLVAVI